jgi:phosphoglycerate dehydrogenase-like enzyme
MRPRIYYTTTVSMVVILLLTTLLLAAVSFPSMVVFKGVVAEADERNDRNRDHSHDQSSNNIGLIGLGAMGTAFARCFIDRGYSVHAWNRSYKKVEDVLGDDRVCKY